ncbi:MAG: tRNA-dihydrouridine synthase [Eubacteriales bacterium]|nr:tRNA-dihydrouridine synthase [Eubacteriales bacterium]
MNNDKTPVLMLAPMAGITDWPFRVLCRRQGADELVTEMISAMGLIQAPKSSRAYRQLLLTKPEEAPIIAQLFGNDPGYLARAAGQLSDTGIFSGIDLNVGCPAPKVTGSGSGAALMKDIPLSRLILAGMRKATSGRLSVKMRLGWDGDSRNYLDYALMCQDMGADRVCVHARTRTQQYSGKADWGAVAQVKRALRIPVVLNGDVFTPQDAVRALDETGADGLAVGRGALGNPWLFGRIKRVLAGLPDSMPSPEEITDMALIHLQLMARFKGDARAVIEMRKHLSWYLRGSPGAAQARTRINTAGSLSELEGILRGHLLAQTSG